MLIVDVLYGLWLLCFVFYMLCVVFSFTLCCVFWCCLFCGGCLFVVVIYGCDVTAYC